MIELIARKREEMNYTLEEKEAFMREALKEAEIALEHDEIPIGCVIVKDGKVIGRGHNAREELQRAVMHAEIMAIENANLSEESWRLLDCTLFVTIEPCVMCSGAIGLARIPNVVYGAKNQKFGAAGSLYDILTDERLNHRVNVETGVLENECAEIMQDFFRQSRERKKEAKREITPLDEALLSGDMKAAVKQYKASQKAKLPKPALVDADQIMQTLSRLSGIPVEKITQADSKRYLNLEAELHKRVIGQDQVFWRPDFSKWH